MPEHLISKWKKMIKPQWKVAFFASILIGFLTHTYIFTNALPNHDGLLNIYSPQMKFGLGRFFLAPFSGIGSYFDLPWINGSLSIFYLALAAIALTELFDLKKNISVILTAGLLVTFPTVTSTFSYMFTADGYMIASLLTIIALLITKKYTYGFLPGAFLFYLSVGVYQANIPFLLTLGTIFLISEILCHHITLKKLMVYILRFIALTVIGMGLYAITFYVYTNFFAGEISDYQGLKEVGSTSSTVSERLTQVNESFEEFFFRGYVTEMPVNLFEVLNVLVFALIVIGFIWFVFNNRLYRRMLMPLIALILLLSLPLSAYSIYFVSPDVSYHMLMVLTLISFYLLPVIFYDNYTSQKFISPALSWSTILISALIVFNFALIANISYFNMNLKYEKSSAFLNRVVYRIEQTEGFDEIKKIAVFGRISMDDNVSTAEVPENVPNMTGMLGNRFLAYPAHYKRMMINYIGISYQLASAEESEKITSSDLYKEMDIWPAESSVQKVNDIIVIKLSN